jgi:SAM-dependent methyltransferase
MLMEE